MPHEEQSPCTPYRSEFVSDIVTSSRWLTSGSYYLFCLLVLCFSNHTPPYALIKVQNLQMSKPCKNATWLGKVYLSSEVAQSGGSIGLQLLRTGTTSRTNKAYLHRKPLLQAVHNFRRNHTCNPCYSILVSGYLHEVSNETNLSSIRQSRCPQICRTS